MEMMEDAFPAWDAAMGRPKSLTLAEAVRMALMRLRRNVTYAELGEDFGMAASSAWTHVQRITDMLGALLAVDVEELVESVKGKICLVDGTLITTFNWHHRKDLFSGKYRKYGMNVQVVADLHGRVIGVSQGFPGSWHDMRCYTQAGWAAIAEAAGTPLGDSGYQGSEMTIPNKKKPGQERTKSDIAHNTAIAVIRVPVEWANAHLKNWRILASRYRDSLTRFDRTINAVAGLVMLNEQYAERHLTFTRLNKLRIVSE